MHLAHAWLLPCSCCCKTACTLQGQAAHRPAMDDVAADGWHCQEAQLHPEARQIACIAHAHVRGGSGVNGLQQQARKRCSPQ